MRIYINNGNGFKDYTVYVVAGTLKVKDAVNVPTLTQFSLVNIDGSFEVPRRSAYVRVVSEKFPDKVLATGYVTNDPVAKPLGMLARAGAGFGFRGYQFDVTVTSDEWMLNVKTAQVYIPAFTAKGQGQILANLAQALAPNLLDVSSFVASGDYVPMFQYSPDKMWSDIAKEFGDASRYRYKVLDGIFYWQPFGDRTLGVTYDEDLQTEGQYEPYGLAINAWTVPVVNDATVVGNLEAGTRHEDNFVGDGFTGSYTLHHPVFDGDTAELLNEAWSGGTLDLSRWNVQDPFNSFELFEGALNVVCGSSPLGQTYLEAQQGVNLGGSLYLQHGECDFSDATNGLLGGVYDGVDFTQAHCLLAFQVTPSTTVSVTASGASGINIQPLVGGVVTGPVVVTKLNKTYLLQTFVGSQAWNRQNQIYRSITGTQFGGDQLQATADVLFVITETDRTSGATVTTSHQVLGVTLPATGLYAVVNVQQANVAITSTLIAGPPQGTLYVGGLTGPSGGQLPVKLPASRNLVVNGDGETGLLTGQATGWTYSSGNNLVCANDFFKFGTRSLKFDNTTPADSYSFQNYSVKDGELYLLSGWIKTTALPTADAGRWAVLNIDVVSGVSAFVIISKLTTGTDFAPTEPDVGIAADGVAHDWTYVESVFQVVGTGVIRLYAQLGNGGAQSGIAWFDHVTLGLAEKQYVLGFGLANQTATIGGTGGGGSSSDAQVENVNQLQFYNDTIPGVGSRIRLRSWAAQAAIGRIRDSVSIAAETTSFLDDGVRAALLLDFKPAPRTSTECEWAAAAAIHDRVRQQFQGTYSILDYFWDGPGSDYPITGRYFQINAPHRRISRRNFLVSEVTTTVLELRQEVMAFEITFGPDLYLERLLPKFLERSSSVLTPENRVGRPSPVELANIGTTTIPDFQEATVLSYDSSTMTIDVGSLPATGCEVRTSDANWTQDTPNLLLRTSQRQFTLSRAQFDRTVYVRQVNGLKYSRYATALRVSAPVIPTAPSLTQATSAELQLDFAGDVRNIYFVELRAADNATVLARRVVTSQQDLYFDLRSIPGGLTSGRTFFAYFGNLMWGYSNQLQIAPAAPPAPTITVGVKMATHVTLQLDQLTRTDIAFTEVTITKDGNAYQTIKQPGQPQFFDFVVDSSTAAFVVTAKRYDLLGAGSASGTTTIPAGNLIASTYLLGQGSIPPNLDDQINALFTYTSSAAVGGGANSAEVIWSWVAFNILFPDGSSQHVVLGAYLTGQVLSSSTSVTTTYYFNPRLKIVTSNIPEFVGGAHSSVSVADSQACIADGYMPLAGLGLTMSAVVPIAPTSGSPGAGGGSDGGDRCPMTTEILTGKEGCIVAQDSKLGNLILGMNPKTGEKYWRPISTLGVWWEECIEVRTQDGGVSRCSVSTPIPVKAEDDSVSEIRYRDLQVGMLIYSKWSEDWVQVVQLLSLGVQEVVPISLEPAGHLFVGDHLTHNNQPGKFI
jgi:hypothetical protein